ncbi:MAG: toll/interleukin-1 receptor domain-containing protein [Thermoplasmata archaeon]|nr:MAG: toll/interleukin-1 receptor domain-containing protein [Thermoplasmata archaeon]
MIRVFISYANIDRKLAERFRDYLIDAEPTKFKPILVELVKKPSESFNEKMAYYLENCDVFIPLITENSLKSRWVNQEIGFAYSLRKIYQIDLIPIVHNREEMDKGFINKYVGLDFVWDEKDVTKTFEEVKNYMLEKVPYPIEIHHPKITFHFEGHSPEVTTCPANKNIHDINAELLIENIGKREIKYLQLGIVYPPSFYLSHYNIEDKHTEIERVPKVLEQNFPVNVALTLFEIKNFYPRTFKKISLSFYRPKQFFHRGDRLSFGIYVAPEGYDPLTYEVSCGLKLKDDNVTIYLYDCYANDEVDVSYSSTFLLPKKVINEKKEME